MNAQRELSPSSGAAASRPVDSAAVAAEHRGGSGPPLLLLHGITASFRVWEPVIPALEEQHEVFAPTLAGHHGAAALDDGVLASVESLTDRLEERLDELEIARPHVVGNSLGGWLALELARRRRASSVVAFSPAATWSSPVDLARVSLLVSGGHLAAGIIGERLRALLARPRGRRALLRLAFEHGERVRPATAQAMLSENSECSVLGEFLRVLWRTGPIRSPLTAPGCPIRIAWPEHDRTTPFERHGQPLLAAVPEAELLRLTGVGHVPMYDDPGLVARTILEHTGSVHHD